jgi:polyketide synthase 7
MPKGTGDATEARLRDYLKRAVADLRVARRDLEEHRNRASEPLAVIGMGVRLPGGINGPQDLWEAVRTGRDLVGTFPVDRGWDLDALYDPTGERYGTSYVRQGAFLDELAMFDAAFFGISPREATAMDPQQRILLEVVWEAFEHARIDPETVRGARAGVFVGATEFDYGRSLGSVPPELEGNAMIGRSGAVTSGRVAYVLGLTGPALTVDTMCSSSLVALHLATRSLRCGDSDLAVVAGTTALSTPEGFIEFSRQRVLSSDGRCRAFAAGADGTGWAEGVAVVLLERLSDARRAGHRILALVRGSGINSDGASNGLTAPNGSAQRRVIEQALVDARITPAEVDAVEAHGTGTVLGDPIEANALLEVYGARRPAGRPLWLGSLKSNLSHSAAASGVAGVVKMVMALREEELPRTLHVDEPTPRVDWSRGGVELLLENRPWPRGESTRRAGVSAFGASGTNVHVILEEAPAAEEAPGSVAGRERAVRPVTTADVPWVISGHTADALRAQARRLRARLRDDERPSACDIGLSLATTRTALAHRAVVIGADRPALLDALDAVATGSQHPRAVLGRAADARRPVFCFPGQGSQWQGMATELLDTSPAFRAAFDECGAALARVTDFSLDEVVTGDDDGWLTRVDVVQPVLWAVMVALAETWRSVGVEPAAVAGHSQGEIAAACVAGALSLSDGARVIALRSAMIARAELPEGGMLSVALPRQRAQRLLAEQGGGLVLAAVNGARSVVVSGPVQALDALTARLVEDGVRHHRIPVDYASHSPCVEPLHDPVVAALAGLEPRTGRIPLYSSVTGSLIDTSSMDGEYWFRNLRATVEMDRVTRQLVAGGHDAFIEVSPHPVLLPAVGETLDELAEQAQLPCEPVLLGSIRRDGGGMAGLLTSVAAAHCAGVRVDWGRAFTGREARVVDLPLYAFQRRRFWVEQAPAGSPGPAGALPSGAAEPAAARRSTVDSWRYHVTWRPVDAYGSARLSGDWLLLAPRGTARERVDEVELALAENGARPVVIDVDTATVTRKGLGEAVASAAGRGPAGVVSLLALGDGDRPGCPGVPRGLAALVMTVQALGDADVGAPLWALTSGAVKITGDDALDAVEQATSWGLGRVAALEYPGRWGGLVDLPAVLGEAGRARLAAVLAGTGEDQVAIRAGGVLGRRLARDGGEGDGTAWTPPGCALLTGGTGGIGSQIARYLARAGTRRIILLSRRGPAARGVDSLLTDLAALGAKAEVVAADVGDADALAVLRDRERDAGTPITGVFHIAGAGRLEPLDTLGMGSVAETVHAKIAGGRALDRVFDGDEVGEFVLFSSISSIWGSGEHGAYAAANAYLDALAERRRVRGRPGTSIVWGIWDPAAGGGMAGNLVEEQLRARGVPFMDPALALEALGPVLAAGRPVPVVARVEWQAFAPVFTSARFSALLTTIPEAAEALREPDTGGADQATGLADRVRHAPAAQRSRLVLDAIRDQVASTLKLDDPEDIELARPLRELGFDSLTAVDLRNRLNALTGLRLRVTIVFDHPNVRSLADAVLRRLVPEGPGDATARRPSTGAAPPAEPAAAPSRAAATAVDIDTLGVDELVEIALARTTPERG